MMVMSVGVSLLHIAPFLCLVLERGVLKVLRTCLVNENKQVIILHVNAFQDEWRFFLAGGTVKPKNIENPSPDWISSRSWNDILTSGVLPKFANFADDFKNHLEGFKKIFDSPEPHRLVVTNKKTKLLV